jgi:uncharacterized protein YyaL (SSP411 family)
MVPAAFFANLALVMACVAGLGCATGGPARPGAKPAVASAAATHRGPDVARARAMGRKPLFTWEPYSEDAFAKARREGKLVLVDGAAAWCHWCHVMDEITYLDPEVGKLVAERFVAVRFDADAAPDLAERYGEWGWPATILLTADAREVGKFRGYLPPEEMRDALGAAVAGRAQAEVVATASACGGAPTRRADAADRPARPEELGWVVASALHQLDEYWDDAEAGWGRRQKAPIGEAIEVEIARAARGDDAALERALKTVEKQRALYDPVWGGVYQYSAAPHWKAPHFEKLATYQASNLAALARAAKRSGRADVLADAEAIRRYVDAFLSSPEGGFYTSQDADLGGHDPKARFVDGHDYYPKGDAARRALGVPRVDTAQHPHENGLLIAAYVALAEAAPESGALARATRAAELLARRVDARGAVARDGGRSVYFLADAAAAAYALARLAEVTREARYVELAARVAERMLDAFGGAPGGALYASTADPDAAGVFAERLVALPGNALAARALAAVSRASNDPRHAESGRRVLAGAATPRAITQQGRMIGGVLLAAFDLGVGGAAEPSRGAIAAWP